MKLNIFTNKLNSKPLPIGGVFLFIMSIFYLENIIFSNPIFFISSLAILILGIVDDLIELLPLQKLIAQNLIIIVFIFFHYNKNFEINVFFLAIILFINLAIINASNIIDGLDGLLVSLALITFLYIYFIEYNSQNDYLLGIIICLSIIGILNLPPAKIYFGDSGAMLIGFYICYFTINFTNEIKMINIIKPIFVFPLPIIDIIFAVFRRILNKRDIFKKDMQHIHHLTFSYTKSKWISLLILSFVQIILIRCLA